MMFLTLHCESANYQISTPRTKFMNQFLKNTISSFLSSKNAPKHFVVKALYDEGTVGEQGVLSILPDEDVEAIRGLKEKYGPEYVKHLSEHFDDEDAIYDLAPGGEILDIEVEGDVYYKVRFTAFVSKDSQIVSHSLDLMLPEPAYARLVEICTIKMDITFNTVFRFDTGVARILYSAIESALGEEFSSSDLSKYPFFITMDEAKDDARKVKDIIFNLPFKKGSNPTIWRLTDATETDKLFAKLDYSTLSDIIHTMFRQTGEGERAVWGVGYDVEGMTEKIFHNLLGQIEYEDDWYLNIGSYELSPIILNTLLKNDEVLIGTPDLELKKGDIVYEAAKRIDMGSEQAYALSPLGYFTQKINHPALEGVEWIERTLL